jgi:hypothetical protein
MPPLGKYTHYIAAAATLIDYFTGEYKTLSKLLLVSYLTVE